MGFLQGEQLAAAYASADYFVYASVSETFGQVYLEAMSSGTPIVAAEGQQMKEFFINGIHGYTWKPDDVASACEALTSAIRDRHILAQNCRSHALNHSWSSAANQIADVYTALSERRVLARPPHTNHHHHHHHHQRKNQVNNNNNNNNKSTNRLVSWTRTIARSIYFLSIWSYTMILVILFMTPFMKVAKPQTVAQQNAADTNAANKRRRFDQITALNGHHVTHNNEHNDDDHDENENNDDEESSSSSSSNSSSNDDDTIETASTSSNTSSIGNNNNKSSSSSSSGNSGVCNGVGGAKPNDMVIYSHKKKNKNSKSKSKKNKAARSQQRHRCPPADSLLASPHAPLTPPSSASSASSSFEDLASFAAVSSTPSTTSTTHQQHGYTTFLTNSLWLRWRGNRSSGTSSSNSSSSSSSSSSSRYTNGVSKRKSSRKAADLFDAQVQHQHQHQQQQQQQEQQTTSSRLGLSIAKCSALFVSLVSLTAVFALLNMISLV